MPNNGRSINNNGSRNYSHKERMVILDNLDRSNLDIQKRLDEKGYERSVASIKVYKHKQMLLKRWV